MSMWDDLFSDDSNTSWFNQAIAPADTGTDITFGDSSTSFGLPLNDPSAFYGDILEATNITFGDSLPTWVSGDSDYQKFFSAFTSGASAKPGDGAPKTVEADKPTADKGGETSSAKGGGLLGRISQFMEQNKELTKLAGGMAYGAYQSQAAKDAAKASARSRIEELNRADELKQAENARVSASVTGLRTPTSATGGSPSLPPWYSSTISFGG